MSKTENSRKRCQYCLHAIKRYWSIGNKLFYKGTLGCFKSPTELESRIDFDEKVNCEYFRPDRIHEPKNDTQQMIAYLSKQIDDVIDLLDDIQVILNPTEDDDNAQKCAENNNDDE